MSEPYMSSYIAPIMDTVGKTIKDVELLSGEMMPDNLILYFTDGTRAVIESSEWISEVRLLTE